MKLLEKNQKVVQKAWYQVIRKIAIKSAGIQRFHNIVLLIHKE